MQPDTLKNEVLKQQISLTVLTFSTRGTIIPRRTNATAVFAIALGGILTRALADAIRAVGASFARCRNVCLQSIFFRLSPTRLVKPLDTREGVSQQLL